MVFFYQLRYAVGVMAMKFEDKRSKEPREREKKSWKEIDAMRDGGYQKERKPDSFSESGRGQAEAKKALADLFTPKKNKEEAKAWKKVEPLSGSRFSKEFSSYLTAYGWPKEFDDLLRALDHADEKIVLEGLEKLLKRLPHESPQKKDLLIGKLRIARMTVEDYQAQKKIDQVIEELSS